MTENIEKIQAGIVVIIFLLFGMYILIIFRTTPSPQVIRSDTRIIPTYETRVKPTGLGIDTIFVYK